jgi:hypothetical protein
MEIETLTLTSFLVVKKKLISRLGAGIDGCWWSCDIRVEVGAEGVTM